ncbi:MAG TPA: RraA family protein [Anseongella sp.]
MKKWKDDDELFSLIKRELFTAVVGDILDKCGYLHQFLPAAIRPLAPQMVIVGRAMTVLEADVFEEEAANSANPVMRKPFGLMFEALDSLQRNEVYICSGASPRYALWGGLMSVRAMYQKAAGAVVNGYSRDTNEVLQLNFPTFSLGGYAQDQGPRGKVMDYRSTIEFGGITVQAGDIIYGDRDGVLVIPRQVEQEVFEGAIEKVRKESQVRVKLLEGMTTVDAFEKFGVM